MTSPATNEALQELLERLDALARERDTLAELQRYFPTAQTANTARIIAKLLALVAALPARFWEILDLFLQCKDEALVELELDHLKALLAAMLAGLEMHLETVPDGPEKEQVRAALRDQLRPLEQVLQAETDPAAAIALLQRAKQTLREFYGEALAALGLLFSAELARELAAASDEAAEEVAKRKQGLAYKIALRRAIVRFIERKAGRAAAQRAVPYVGLVLTLAEVAALGMLSEQLESLEREACRLMCRVLDEVLERDWGWADQTFTVFLERSVFKPTEHALVTARAEIRCHRVDPSGECRWDTKGCPVPFADGESSKSWTVKGHGPEDFNPSTGSYEWPVELDQAAADAAECLEGADKCALFLRVTVRFLDAGAVAGRSGPPALSLVGARRIGP